jgi:hypothetical protein
MWGSVLAFSSANLIHFSAIKRKVAAATGSGVFRAARAPADTTVGREEDAALPVLTEYGALLRYAGRD